MNLKITFGIIVYNGDFFLKQLLESIYPFAHAICIAEGTVSYYKKRGIITSNDNTNEILRSFPDPLNKIKVVHGTWSEKDDQCRAMFSLVPTDTDYLYCNDADELMTNENYENIIRFIEKENPTSLGFKSNSFYGGFHRIIGGFERNHSFKRVLKYVSGCSYLRHRQPTLDVNGVEICGKDITGEQLFNQTGVEMWHGSYVSAKGVHDKIEYYESAVIQQGNCIPNYFKNVWLRWVQCPEDRFAIEQQYKGVHEFKPEYRGDAFTEAFNGKHPEIILRDFKQLESEFYCQVFDYIQ